MEQQDMAGELAYVRALAEEGRHAPLVGGSLYALWGGLISVAAVVQYGLSAGWIPYVPGAIWILWVGVLAVGWALSFYLGRRSRRKPGAMTVGNRTSSAAWFGVGLFISGFWFTLMIVHDNFTALGIPPYFLFSLMFPVAFGAYGIAFLASATAAKLPWLRWFAYGAWGFSFLSLVFLASDLQMLIAAAGTLTCAFVPGVMLMRHEPSEIV